MDRPFLPISAYFYADRTVASPKKGVLSFSLCRWLIAFLRVAIALRFRLSPLIRVDLYKADMLTLLNVPVNLPNNQTSKLFVPAVTGLVV